MQQLQLEGVSAAAAKCDVTQKSEVEQLVDWTVDTYGSLDIMVANAGIVKAADFLDMSEADWDAVIDVNLKGTFIVRSPPAMAYLNLGRTFFDRMTHVLSNMLPGPLGCIVKDKVWLFLQGKQ